MNTYEHLISNNALARSRLRVRFFGIFQKWQQRFILAERWGSSVLEFGGEGGPYTSIHSGCLQQFRPMDPPKA